AEAATPASAAARAGRGAADVRAAPTHETDEPTVDDIARQLRGVTRFAVIGAARNVGTTSTAIALARVLSRQGAAILVALALIAPRVGAVSGEPGAAGGGEAVRGGPPAPPHLTRDPPA